MDKLPKRKLNRVQGYNYSRNGAYFVTICADKHRYIFGDISVSDDNAVGAIHESPVTELSAYGKIVDSYINILPDRFKIYIDNYVIMPNHVHLLITIDDDNPENRYERAIRESPLQSRSTLSKIVGYLKMNISKEIHKINPQINVWQRSYYEHIIRNEKDYFVHYEYIENNPIKWKTDDYFIR